MWQTIPHCLFVAGVYAPVLIQEGERERERESERET
jgi:hypothetical protein